MATEKFTGAEKIRSRRNGIDARNKTLDAKYIRYKICETGSEEQR